MNPRPILCSKNTQLSAHGKSLRKKFDIFSGGKQDSTVINNSLQS
jgi:hypothetical protein